MSEILHEYGKENVSENKQLVSVKDNNVCDVACTSTPIITEVPDHDMSLEKSVVMSR